ncbi:MAG TPA: hypothetical protein VKG26_01560 [Bacteroidia bacterium]|nr:hypothetical protein [Bacteroidia bacterium]
MFDISEFIEFLFDIFFEGFLIIALRLIGSLFRYPFLFHKYTYRQVLKQEYNGRVGLIVVFVITIASVCWLW